MINPQEMLALYGVLIEGTSTQTIREAEKHIRELYALPAFWEINKLVLIEEQIPISVKKMSAVHVAHFARKNNKNAVVSPEAFAKGLLEVLCNDRLEHTLKPLLLQPLEQLLSEEGSGHLRTALVGNLVHNLKENHMDFKEAVFVGQALIGKRANSSDIKGVVLSTFPYYCGLASQLHDQAAKVTESNTLIQLLRLVGDYSKLMRSLVARIGLLDSETVDLIFLPQFQQAVRTAFELSLPGNAFSSQIFFDIPDQANISSLINSIKRNYIIIFATFLRITVGSIKDQEKLSKNPLYAKSASIVEYCIQATFNLLQSKPYYQLPQQTHLVSSLFEMLGLLITTMRIRFFDLIYASHRSEIIEKVFLPCLIFSPQDVDEFYENQSEFVGKILQINDDQALLKRKKEEDSDIEQFDTLKTYAGQGIRVLCKYQSEFLAEILEFTFNIIEGKMGCPLPKSVFLLLASLLKTQISLRPEYVKRLGNYLTLILKSTNPPVVDASERKEEDIEYALVLLAASKYVGDEGLDEDFFTVAFQRGVSILSRQKQNEVYNILVFQLFDEINSLENGEDFALDLLNLYNSLLAHGEPSLRLLDSYSQLLQYNLEFFKAHIQSLMVGIFLICRIVEKQLQKPQPVQLFLNKSFNVVREIGESPSYLPAVIPELQQALLPILPYIDGREGIDLQEDILLMLAAFLEHGKSVTLAQQKMFEIIPKVFYTQYHCTFGQAFTTIHSFIHYGATLLASAPQATQAIIEMSIASMTLKESGGRELSEIDNCEGVLVLQSLALACGSFITKETWIVILHQLVGRLSQPIQENRLYANILGLISLILVHTQSILSNEENSALLAHILRGANRCLRIKWADKVLIVGLSELMTNIDKQFIKSSFPSIFQFILTLLDSITIKSTVRDAIARARADEDFDYDNLITLVRNNIKDLDEFTFFKLQFKKIHSQKLDFVNEMMEKLPSKLKDFLGRIMTTERVANEARTIFKIKKN